MKISLILLLIGMMFPSEIQSQVEVIINSATEVDENRYDNVNGSPFLWKEWHNGIIYDQNGQSYSVEELNFDGYRHMINIKEKNKFYEIDLINFPKFECLIGGERRLFYHDRSGKFNLDFVEVLHEGSRISLVTTFRVSKKIRKKDAGDGFKEIVRENFDRNTTYYFIRNEEKIEIESSKKGILSILDFSDTIENFVDNKKLRKNRRAHLKEIAEYYDSL